MSAPQQKLKYSVLHHNRGNKVTHNTIEKYGVGTITEILGENPNPDNDDKKDIEYGVVWETGDFEYVWHADLKKVEAPAPLVEIDNSK